LYSKVILSGDNPDLVAAIVGGVVGGLVVILLITLLGFGIATAVILNLRKKGEYTTDIASFDITHAY
jgi:hypothetical protein